MTILSPLESLQAKKNKSKDYWPKQSEKISAESAIVMDADTGTILYSKKINKKYYPASITKILTTLIAIENSKMDETVIFSQDSVYKTEGSGIARDVGEKMTMEQCLYAIMLESANECAYAVAEHIGGTVEKFVNMMNKKAKKLGCTSSHFSNPHGLPNENHYVTARDMAVIAKAAYKNETFRLICGTKRYTIPKTNKHKEQTPLVNHHKMLYPKDTAEYLYEYCMGGKTGYTVAAGNTLVTYAQKDGMTLIVVILKGTSPQYWIETKNLFDFGFENFSLCNVSESSESSDSELKEKYDTLNTNAAYAQIDPQAKIVLPKAADFSKAKTKISYKNLPENIVAKLSYTYGNHKIGTANVIRTDESFDKEEVATVSTDSEYMQAESDDLENNPEAKENQTITEKEMQDKEEKEDLEAKNPDEKKSIKDADKSSNGIVDTVSEIVSNAAANVKNFFSDVGSNIKIEKLKGLIEKVRPKTIFAIGAVIILVIVFIVLGLIINNSYMIRQRIANYKNRKREKRQYVTIKDTRKTKRRKRR